MSSNEHLDLIVAHLTKLLTISKDRTPGEWESRCNHKPYKVVWISKKDYYSTLELHPQDADFIAACSVNSERGWRSTLAAIEGLRGIINFGDDETGETAMRALDAIRAEWPVEVLAK